MTPPLLGNLVTICGMALWSTGFPVTELLLESWHPLLLTPARLGLASLSLAGFLLLAGRGRELRGVPWRAIIKYGAIGIGFATLLLITGQFYSDPVTVSIITTAVPLVAAVMGFLAGDERLNPAILAGVALAISGGVLATLARAGEGPGFQGGELLIICSTTLFVWYTRGTVKHLSGVSAIAKVVLTLGAGAAVLLPVALVAGLSGAVELRYDLSPRSLALLLWLGCVAVGLSMTCWLTGCRLLGSVTIAAIHQNSVPIFVMLASLAIGGQLFLGQIWGALLVIAGALLAQLPQVTALRRLVGRR